MTEYIRGAWYDLQEQAQSPPGTGLGPGSTVANELVTWTIIVHDDVYLTGVRYFGGILASGTVRFMMWNPSPTTGHAAGFPVVDSGAVAIPTSGAATTRSITFANRLFLPAGIYRGGFLCTANGLQYSSLQGYDSNRYPFHDAGLNTTLGGSTGALVNARHFNLGSGSLNLTGAEVYTDVLQTNGANYNPAAPNGFIQPWVEWQVAPIPPMTGGFSSGDCASPATWDGVVYGDSLLAVGTFAGFSVPESAATITFTTSGGATVSPGSGALSSGPWLCTVPIGGSVAYRISIPGTVAADRTLEICSTPTLLPLLRGVNETSDSRSGQTSATPMNIPFILSTSLTYTMDIAFVEIADTRGTVGLNLSSQLDSSWTLIGRHTLNYGLWGGSGSYCREWWWRPHSTTTMTATIVVGNNGWRAGWWSFDRTVPPHIASTVDIEVAVSPTAPLTTVVHNEVLNITASRIGAVFVNYAKKTLPDGLVYINNSSGILGFPLRASGANSATALNQDNDIGPWMAIFFLLASTSYDSNCLLQILTACVAVGDANVGLVAVGPPP